jgi:1,4-dihydroxy-2-naphthoate octaprenyltransferase
MNNDEKQLSVLQIWWLAIRPKTLLAAIGPVLVGWGIGLGESNFRWAAAFAALFGAVAIQIGTNLINDVVDFTKGADTETRQGPVRVTQTGMLSAKQVWRGAIFSFSLATLAGIYLIYVGGLPILVIGVASILAGIAYSAGPYPLAYVGLADLFVMVFFGFIAVGGTTYVTSGALPEATWLGALGVGAMVTAILVVNNIRDIEDDRAAGRRNIPVAFGRKAGEWEYGVLLLSAYLAPVAAALLGYAHWIVIITFLSLPFALRLYRTIRGGAQGAALNPILGQTAQLGLQYSALLAAAFAIDALFL